MKYQVYVWLVDLKNCLEFGVEFQILEIILKWGLVEASSILFLHLLVIVSLPRFLKASYSLVINVFSLF